MPGSEKLWKPKAFFITHLAAQCDLNWPEAIYNPVCVLLSVNIHLFCCRIIKILDDRVLSQTPLEALCNTGHMGHSVSEMGKRKIINSEAYLVPRIWIRDGEFCHEGGLLANQEQLFVLDSQLHFPAASCHDVWAQQQLSPEEVSIQVLGLDWPALGRGQG